MLTKILVTRVQWVNLDDADDINNSYFNITCNMHLYFETIYLVVFAIAALALIKVTRHNYVHIQVSLIKSTFCKLWWFTMVINTLRPRQNGRHFADGIFKRIFLNENILIPIKISLKFVPKGPINNIPALVQIMAWRRPGDKPLSQPMMVNLTTHICVTRPQWVKCLQNVQTHWSPMTLFGSTELDQ